MVRQNPQPLSGWLSLLSWLVSVLVPIMLLLTSIRIILFPGFISFEYSMPGFPVDLYGFTKQERLYWSRIAVEYLTNDQEINFLSDQRFENGAPVFNERELVHMVDVKRVVTGAITAWKVVLGLLILLALVVWFGKFWQVFREGLGRGGWLTLILILGIIAFVLGAFGILFVAFHNIFFEPGTWTFLWSDTLIRLFPERFWRDLFIYLGLLSVLLGVVTIQLSIGFKRKSIAS